MARGTNAGLMKENNKKLILNLIRQGDFSRADIAKEIKLTKATLSILADEMTKEGLITEESVSEYSGVGRRPSYLRLREDARYAIGLGLTRSGYRAGLFYLGGNPIAVEKYSYVSDEAEKNLEDMAEVILKYKKMVPEDKILGVGVAAPGPLDYKKGKILNPPNFKVWHNCEFEESLSALCGLQVKLENIANAMAIAERYFGCCRKDNDFAYVVVDEGIGAGIIVGGKIYRGHRGYGNELGHISIAYDGVKCTCGNRGCLERYASIPAILGETQYKTWEEVVLKKDFDLINKEAEYLGCGIIGLLNLFDLGTIVLGGSIREYGEPLADKISEIVNERTIVRHPIRVVLSEAGQNRALAAASVALSRFFF